MAKSTQQDELSSLKSDLFQESSPASSLKLPSRPRVSVLDPFSSIQPLTQVPISFASSFESLAESAKQRLRGSGSSDIEDCFSCNELSKPEPTIKEIGELAPQSVTTSITITEVPTHLEIPHTPERSTKTILETKVYLEAKTSATITKKDQQVTQEGTEALRATSPVPRSFPHECIMEVGASKGSDTSLESGSYITACHSCSAGNMGSSEEARSVITPVRRATTAPVRPIGPRKLSSKSVKFSRNMAANPGAVFPKLSR